MNEHYFTQHPTSKIVEKEFTMNFEKEKVKFTTVSGVFSFGKPDKASMMLVKHVSSLYGDVLDLGCGYGLIGISLKILFPDINIYMSDVNERAVRYAKINAKNNNVIAEIKAGDGLSVWDEKLFDFIIFNPPVAAGKKVWTKMIQDSRKHLKNDGTLICVGFHNKAGKTIEREMKTIFHNVSTLAKSGGIRLYASRKEK
jgi:16S rRNA (guanine1207-N2)-methyltransferase